MTIIKFSAPWCQPCKRLEPLFAAAAEPDTEESAKTIYMDVDIEETAPEVLATWGIQSVPTIVTLDHDGNEIGRSNKL